MYEYKYVEATLGGALLKLITMKLYSNVKLKNKAIHLLIRRPLHNFYYYKN